MKNKKHKNKLQEYSEEKIEQLIEQFEEDSKTQDFKDPFMERFFKSALEDIDLKNKVRKTQKFVGIAASMALVLGATNICTQNVYGESLFTIVKNSIEAGQFTITSICKNDDSGFEEYDTPIICYEADTIEGIFEELIADITTDTKEIFYLSNFPKKYTQWYGKFNTKFQKLTIRSQENDSCLYIYEELDYDDTVSGTVLESEIASSVFNENLQMTINIIRQMDDVRNQGYYFEVFLNNKRLRVEGNGSLKEFEEIAETVSFLKGE